METTSYAQMKINRAVTCLKKLANVYENSGARENVIALEYEELAQILENTVGAEKMPSNRKLKKTLNSMGIRIVKSVRYGENIIIEAFATKSCVRTRDVADAISEILGKPYDPEYDSPNIVSKTVDEYMFCRRNNYYVSAASRCISKNQGAVSGDSFTFMPNFNGKMHAGIVDGMGVGVMASLVSTKAIELYEQFVNAGFSMECAARMVNSAMAAKHSDMPVTLDLTMFDLQSGLCRVCKLGGAATYIKNQDNVRIVKADSLPAGVLDEVVPQVTSLLVPDNSCILMLSDGVIDALPFYDKEQQMQQIVRDTPFVNPEQFVDKMMEEIMFYIEDEPKDDMTILCIGIWKRIG